MIFQQPSSIKVKFITSSSSFYSFLLNSSCEIIYFPQMVSGFYYKRTIPIRAGDSGHDQNQITGD